MVNQKCVGIPAFQGKMSESYQSKLATWDLGIMMERENFGLFFKVAHINGDDSINDVGGPITYWE